MAISMKKERNMKEVNIKDPALNPDIALKRILNEMAEKDVTS